MSAAAAQPATLRPPPTGLRFWLSDAGQGRLRLWTGLVLFTFAATHLLNHGIGLVSLDAVEAARPWFLAFWRALPAELALYLSLVLHPLLALIRLWRRRGLARPWIEWLQIVLGVMIPGWLTVHVIANGVTHRLWGHEDSYTFELDIIWPHGMTFQTQLTALVWIHGCIGIWRWLRLKPWFVATRAPLLALAVLIPTLAVLGTISAGRDFAARKAADPGWLERVALEERWPPWAERDRLIFAPERAVQTVFLALLGLLVAARGARSLLELRGRRVRVLYDGGVAVRGIRGMTLLEMSRVGGVPHASVCGGRGRCSTCRVRIVEGAPSLPPPAPEEQRVLERIYATQDVRLACQIRPTGALSIVRLAPADAGLRAVLKRLDTDLGREVELAVMFADLRGFTRLAEGRLPYDTVFLLNRYFHEMGAAIEAAGGRVDKFIGDGIMALFGIGGTPEEAARSALAAARAMAHRLDALNVELAGDLREPLRIGIGLHLGPAIIGEMGYGRTVSLTAIGDTVNIASRLEPMTKELAAQLVVSQRLVQRSGLSWDGATPIEVDLRGREGRISVLAIIDARTLPGAEPPTLGLAQRLRQGLVSVVRRVA